MPKPQKQGGQQPTPTNKPTPTFLLELPLAITPGQAKRLCAHLEAARQLYNALLSEGQRRLRRMRADPAWQAARAIPRTQKQERQLAFAALRRHYGFSEYALHDAAKGLNCAQDPRPRGCGAGARSWPAAPIAPSTGSAWDRPAGCGACSRGRGLGSVENKRNNTGLRFLLQPPEEGNQGYLLWQDDRLLALIDWKDPVVTYGLAHPIKYARLLQRQASSARAEASRSSGPALLRATGALWRPLPQAQAPGR